MTPGWPFVPTDKDTISVGGEASRSVIPDTIDITISVQTTGATAGQALRDNAMRVQRAIQAASALGLQQGDVATMGVQLRPNHPGLNYLNLFATPAPAPTTSPDLPGSIGYLVDNTIKLTVRDPNRVGEILDAVVAAGANLVSNIIFRVRDDSQIRKAVLEAAVADARLKAEAIAVSMGRQIGNAMLTNEEAGPFFGGGAPGFTGGVAPLAAGPVATPIVARDLTYSARVRIIFIVR